MSQIPVALQLFTVRELLADDYAGTLQKVKEMGYDLVQLTGQMPFEAPRMKEMLEGMGLVVAGIHVGLDGLEGELQRWIDYCQTVGTQDLVCPFLPQERRGTREDWLLGQTWRSRSRGLRPQVRRPASDPAHQGHGRR
jgi:sugar phosphate isomerase/epimerase